MDAFGGIKVGRHHFKSFSSMLNFGLELSKVLLCRDGKVTSHDTSLDLCKLRAKAKRLLPTVRRTFKKWGIKNKPMVYVTSYDVYPPP